MIAYIDSSVLLRKLFREPDQLQSWQEIDHAFASRLVAVEVRRAIDRARLASFIGDPEVDELHEELRCLLRSIDVVALSEPVLTRAEGAMPTVVGSLDAIHLATALILAPTLDAPLVFATHDGQLGRAARASGLAVTGSPL